MLGRQWGFPDGRLVMNESETNAQKSPRSEEAARPDDTDSYYQHSLRREIQSGFAYLISLNALRGRMAVKNPVTLKANKQGKAAQSARTPGRSREHPRASKIREVLECVRSAPLFFW